MNDNLQDLQAALNKNITDPDGQPTEDDTSIEEPAPQEKTEVEEPTEAEKPAESKGEESNPEPEEDETEHVEDEEGKKYVPEKRFKDVYKKGKEAERRAKELEAQLRAVSSQAIKQPLNPVPRDKADALETELLFNQFPPFDPTSDEYDEDLDKTAANIYLASQGAKTKLEAAREAMQLAKKFAARTTSIKEETKTFKKGVSESITVKGGQRVEPQPDPDKMSAAEIEAYLKEHKQW